MGRFQMDVLIILSVIFCIAVVSICAANIGHLSELRSKVTRRKKARSTFFADINDSDDRCDICFGRFGIDGEVTQCSCGKVFHPECVGMTEECPYCHESPSSMTVRPVKRPTCPQCGKKMDSDICSCGAILPRMDGTFQCICGHTMHIDSARCPQCGTGFMPVRKSNNR